MKKYYETPSAEVSFVETEEDILTGSSEDLELDMDNLFGSL